MSGVHVRTNMWEIERDGGGSYREREREEEVERCRRGRDEEYKSVLKRQCLVYMLEQTCGR